MEKMTDVENFAGEHLFKNVFDGKKIIAGTE